MLSKKWTRFVQNLEINHVNGRGIKRTKNGICMKCAPPTNRDASIVNGERLSLTRTF